MTVHRAWSRAGMVAVCFVATNAQALTYELAGGGASWPSDARDVITRSMEEAVGTYNRYGFFDKRVTANHNPGVPTAEANYDGWISFGGQRSTRTALHEIAHTLGTGTYWNFGGGQWDENSAAGRLIKVFDGQGARLSTGGTHFWPYGLNYDNEDGAAARERHCKLVSAFRFDMGIVKDSDADGLPDDWETFHFQNLAQGANADPDGDGITNEHEYGTDCDPARAAPVRDGRVYVIRGQISRRALTVIGASVAEAAGTEQREPDGLPWQQWTARYEGEGYFSFTNVKSGLVLEVPSTDTASALPIRQARWTGARKQQWRITTGPGAEAGYYQIANRETGRVADGLDGKDGAPVQQYPFIGAIPQQFWAFQELSTGDDPGDAGVPDAAGTGGAAIVAPGSGGTGGARGSGGAGGATSGSGGTAASSGGIAATSGGSSSSSGGAATGGAATGGATTGADDPDGGCDCGLASGTRDTSPHLVLAGLALAWLRRYRRRGAVRVSA